MADKRKVGQMQEDCISEPDDNGLVSAVGYLHNVLPVTTSKKNYQYFKARLQMKDEVFSVVCHSADKQSTFKQAENLKSPVKLKKIKLSPGKSSTDIIVNKRSTMDILAKPLSFARRLELPPETSAPLDIQINNLKSHEVDNSKSYNIKGKVLKMEDAETATIFGQNKMIQNIIVADETSAICLKLYEKNCGTLEVNKSYEFNNVALREYGTVKNLTCKQSTTIIPLENDIAVKESYEEENMTVSTESVRGKIQSLQIISIVKCPHCHMSMKNTDASNFTRCSTCKMKTKSTNLSRDVIAKIDFICSDGNVKKVTALKTILSEFLTSNNKQYLLNDIDSLEEYFLDDTANYVFEITMQTVMKITLV